MAVTYLKVTNTEVVAKAAGGAGTNTIDIQSDNFIPYLSMATQVGTITCSTTSNVVTGTETNFTTNWIGSKLYNSAGTFIGIVTGYTSPTSITLGANAAINVSGEAFKAEHQAQKLDGPTQIVNITGITWTGSTSGVATIARGGTTIATVTGGSLGALDFSGQDMPPENTNNTADIDVTISGGQMEVWLKLRKISGWTGTYDIAKMGSYADPVTPGV